MVLGYKDSTQRRKAAKAWKRGGEQSNCSAGVDSSATFSSFAALRFAPLREKCLTVTLPEKPVPLPAISKHLHLSAWRGSLAELGWLAYRGAIRTGR